MVDTTAAPETATEANSDVLTPQEESQLKGEVEKPAEKAPEVKKEPEKEKVVPYNALHEERMLRKKERERNKELEERVQQGERRLAELAEKFKPAPPKFEENPAAHLKHQLDTVQSKLAETEKFKEEHQQQLAEQRKQQEFIETYRAKAADFTQTTPDFMEGYNFLRKARFDELKEAGYKPEKIHQILINEEKMIVEDAFNDEENPAERLYKMAKVRGYAKEKSQEQKQIETVQKGLEASQTLSKGGGASKGLSMQALAEMSEEEFNKLDEATFRKIMGG